MEVVESFLDGACVIRQRRIADERGYFARAFCEREFEEFGLEPRMIQMNVGFSWTRGTLRGMHFQIAPHQEAKFVFCTRGAIMDVVVDVRRSSDSFGRWKSVELSPDNGLMMYVPPGFAHGYQTLVDNTEMYYLTSAEYAPDSARGVSYRDPQIGINWPLEVSSVSDADAKWPLLKHLEI